MERFWRADAAAHEKKVTFARSSKLQNDKKKFNYKIKKNSFCFFTFCQVVAFLQSSKKIWKNLFWQKFGQLTLLSTDYGFALLTYWTTQVTNDFNIYIVDNAPKLN